MLLFSIERFRFTNRGWFLETRSTQRLVRQVPSSMPLFPTDDPSKVRLLSRRHQPPEKVQLQVCLLEQGICVPAIGRRERYNDCLLGLLTSRVLIGCFA